MNSGLTLGASVTGSAVGGANGFDFALSKAASRGKRPRDDENDDDKIDPEWKKLHDGAIRRFEKLVDCTADWDKPTDQQTSYSMRHKAAELSKCADVLQHSLRTLSKFILANRRITVGSDGGDQFLREFGDDMISSTTANSTIGPMLKLADGTAVEIKLLAMVVAVLLSGRAPSRKMEFQSLFTEIKFKETFACKCRLFVAKQEDAAKYTVKLAPFLRAGKIVSGLKGVLERIYAPSLASGDSSNPFGRFSSDPIIVVSDASEANGVALMKDAVLERFPAHKDGNITYQNQPPPGNKWKLQFKNCSFVQFEVYQQVSNAQRDTFILDIEKKQPVLDGLSDKAKKATRRAKRAQRSCNVKRKISRKSTGAIMGLSANQAAAKLGIEALKHQKYEWLHLYAHSLTDDADIADNLMIGTDAANTWMMVYEKIAHLALSAGKKVAVSCIPFYTSLAVNIPKKNKKTEALAHPLAPEKITYIVFVDGVNRSQADIDVRRRDTPSKFLLHLVHACYKTGFGVQAASHAGLKLWVEQPSIPSPFCAVPAHLYDNMPSLKAMTPQRQVDPQKLAQSLGLSSFVDLNEAKDAEALYDKLVALDPDAMSVFPHPKSLPNDVRVVEDHQGIVFDFSGKQQMLKWPFHAYVQILSDGSYWCVSALYPAANELFGDVWDKLAISGALRLVLLHHGEPTAGLRVACSLDVGALFRFVFAHAATNAFEGMTLDFAGHVCAEPSYRPVVQVWPNAMHFPTQLSATLEKDGGWQVCRGLSLNSLRLCPHIVPVLQVDRSVKREFGASFSAVATLNFKDDQHFSFVVGGCKIGDDELAMTACIEDWKHPFGVSGITIDCASLTVTVKPALSISMSALLHIDDSMIIALRGAWTHDGGLVLQGRLEGDLTLDSLIRIHHKVTSGSAPLAVDTSSVPAFCIQDATVSLRSKPASFKLSGKCDMLGTGAILDVTVSVNNGIQFVSNIKDVHVLGDVHIDEAKVEFDVNPAKNKRVFFAASTTYQLPFGAGPTVDMGIIYYKTSQNENDEKTDADTGATGAVCSKCAIATVDAASFQLSHIRKELVWLNFGFTSLRFTVSSAELENMSWKETSSIAVPKGKVLSGVAHFELLNALLGHDAPLDFQYHFQDGNFVITPHSMPPTVKSKRLAIGSSGGLDFRIETEKPDNALGMTVAFATALTFLGEPLEFAARFRIVRAGTGFSIGLFGEVSDKDGFVLKLGPFKSPPITRLSIGAEVSSAGNVGSLTMGGTFTFGSKATASLDIGLTPEPAQDSFVAEITGATLDEIITFGAQILGIKLPKMPLMHNIDVNTLKVRYTPSGLTLGQTYYPPGFSFDADLSITAFGGTQTVQTMMLMSPARFSFDLVLSPFKIANLIEIGSADGKSGAEFHLMADKQSTPSIRIDCQIKFLGFWAAALVKIKPSASYDIDFKFDIFGIEAEFKVESNDGKFTVHFELGDEHKEHARQKSIELVLQAAKNMQKDAKKIKEQTRKAAHVYDTALNQLQENMKFADQMLNTYTSMLTKQLETENVHWKRTVEDAESDIHDLLKKLDKNSNAAENAYHNAVNTLKQDIKQLGADIKVEESRNEALSVQLLNAECKAAEDWKDRIEQATTAWKAADTASNSAEQSLKDIENQKPKGRSCSHREKQHWQDRIDVAKRKLKICRDKLLTGDLFLQEQKKNKTDEIKEIEAALKQQITSIKNDIKTKKNKNEHLKADLNTLTSEETVRQLHRLGPLKGKRELLRKMEDQQINCLAQSFSSSHECTQANKCCNQLLCTLAVKVLQDAIKFVSIEPTKNIEEAKKKLEDAVARIEGAQIAIDQFMKDLKSKVSEEKADDLERINTERNRDATLTWLRDMKSKLNSTREQIPAIVVGCIAQAEADHNHPSRGIITGDWSGLYVEAALQIVVLLPVIEWIVGVLPGAEMVASIPYSTKSWLLSVGFDFVNTLISTTDSILRRCFDGRIGSLNEEHKELDSAGQNIRDSIKVLTDEWQSGQSPLQLDVFGSAWTVLAKTIAEKIKVCMEEVDPVCKQPLQHLCFPTDLRRTLSDLFFADFAIVSDSSAVYILQRLEAINEDLIKIQAVLFKSQLRVVVLKRSVKKWLDENYAPYRMSDADIMSVFEQNDYDVCTEGATPFIARLSALDAVQFFANSAIPLISAANETIAHAPLQIKKILADIQWYSSQLEMRAQQLDNSRATQKLLAFCTSLSEFAEDNLKHRIKSCEEYKATLGKLCLDNNKLRVAITEIKQFVAHEKLYVTVDSALRDAAHEYAHVSMVLKRNVYNPVEWRRAKDDLEAANEEWQSAYHALEKAKIKFEDARKSKHDEYKTKREPIDAEIKIIEDDIGDRLKAFLKDVMVAKASAESTSNEIEEHLHQMKKDMETGRKKLDDVLHSQHIDQSLPGKHARRCRDAVHEWKTNPLWQLSHDAGVAAKDAADEAVKAAEIYKRIMENNQLSFGCISGKAIWDKTDFKFSVRCQFDFHLHIDVNVGGLHININVPLPRANVDLPEISLSEIEHIFVNAGKKIWDAIRHEMSK